MRFRLVIESINHSCVVLRRPVIVNDDVQSVTEICRGEFLIPVFDSHFLIPVFSHSRAAIYIHISVPSTTRFRSYSGRNFESNTRSLSRKLPLLVIRNS